MDKNIRHSVIFKFKDGISPSDETAFFNAAKELAKIPGIQHFEILKQTSKKNPYTYGISMEFATQTLYDQYNHYPAHVLFIQNYWLKNITDFLEIDYEGME